jgi:hypothetical protein
MFSDMKWFRRRAPVASRTRRSRALRAEVDRLEGRALLSGATSAVAWTVGTVTHSAFYAIGQNDNVEASIDGGGFVNLGGYAKQISAGLDVFNKPEVYAIGSDNAVWVDDGKGWVSLGGYAKQISATVENTIYAIGTNDDIFVGHGTPGAADWFDSGLRARQISAGATNTGNPQVFAIGFNNNVYAGNGSGGGGSSFADWGGFSKQIQGTMDGVVYAIGGDNAVYKNSGSGGGAGWVNLGLYAKQISAGIDASSGPFVLAIGSNDGLWSNHGGGWVSLGGYVTDIAGPAIASFGVNLPTNLAYVVGAAHGGFLYRGTGFSSIGGYVQTPSGSTDNNTNTWEPATRDTSSISWETGNVTHTTLYAIGPNDNVEMSVDGGAFTNLGGYAKQVSAGLDAFNRPEVFIIGADNAVWFNDGSGWLRVGGYVKEISATVNNTCYAIGTNDAVFLTRGVPGYNFVQLGSLYAKQISAGTDFGGHTYVFAIGSDDSVYENKNDLNSWISLGNYAKQISATMNGFAYAIGETNAVWEYSPIVGNWVYLGGYAKQISASVGNASPFTGGPFVLAIGLNDGLWSNHGLGWNSLGGPYVTEVSAPGAGNFGISLIGDLAYVVTKGHGGALHKGTPFTPISAGTIE